MITKIFPLAVGVKPVASPAIKPLVFAVPVGLNALLCKLAYVLPDIVTSPVPESAPVEEMVIPVP
jgi:hypothetical protein